MEFSWLKKTYIVIITNSLFFVFSTTAQNKNYDKLIIGKWIGTKKETKKGNDKLLDGRPNKELGVYEFKENGLAFDYTLSPQVSECNYLIQKDVLILGRLSFKIEKVTQKELILLDYKKNDPNNPLVFRHYFYRKK